MRSYHTIAVVAVILIGIGAKLFFFSVPPVEVNVSGVKSASMDILQMERDFAGMKKTVQKMNDMTFVYSDDDVGPEK